MSAHVDIAVIAGRLVKSDLPTNPSIGQQFRMGDSLSIHIQPDIARQWIGALEAIASKESN